MHNCALLYRTANLLAGLNLNIPANTREYFRLTDFWTTLYICGHVIPWAANFTEGKSLCTQPDFRYGDFGPIGMFNLGIYNDDVIIILIIWWWRTLEHVLDTV
jgi:hypothetical protein